MKKSERPKASKHEDGVDLISSMPDGVLLMILSCNLRTEEVVRSSILSRRWRYLWTAIPSVEIDVRYKENVTQNTVKQSEFKEFVYWVLSNRSADLDCFRLFCFDFYSMSTVGRWIHIAVTRNVKRLVLGFGPKERAADVELPHCLVNCGSLEVLNLCLWGRRLRLPNVMGFPALRVLHLSEFNLPEDGDWIKGFFESLPLLEELSLTNCFMEELDLLCISCLKLKTLSLGNIDDLLMCDGIKISCPKLVDLDITDSLKKAEIQSKLNGSTISVLFPGISRVEHLSIGLYFFIECINAALDPSLPKMKTLVLKTTMDAFTMDNFNQILKYYPKLESLKLVIEEDFDETCEWLDEAETRKLWTPDVKKVEFFEFNGEKPELDIDWFEDIMMVDFTWGKKNRYAISKRGMEEHLEKEGVKMEEVFVKEVRSGTDTLFWLDNWCGVGTLKDAFPHLYKLEKRKKCKVGDQIKANQLQWDWKSQRLAESLTRDRKLSAGYWRGRLVLQPCRGWKLPVIKWTHDVPIKVSCFIWRANMGRIPTACDLMKRGVPVNSPICSFCSGDDEGTLHTLWSCPFATTVWEWILKSQT
ncbi:hypothetical protein LXL04_003257 [Taraxacum kok-saghyz]